MRLSLFRRKPRQPERLLDEGWQFFSRPNNLEGPGTVFRIDNQGRRYIVDQLTLKVSRGAEPGTRYEGSIDTSLSILAKLIGLDLGAKLAGRRARKLEFEVTDPVREVTTDADSQAVLDAFVRDFKLRERNRYFVIREARSAAAMLYRLTKEHMAELGGEGPVSAALSAGASLAVKASNVFEITQPLPERLRVMFLPEEVKVVGRSLGAAEPTLGLVRVREPLEWEDA
jgi:hypothetical protein